jgi:hypothetical protein
MMVHSFLDSTIGRRWRGLAAKLANFVLAGILLGITDPVANVFQVRAGDVSADGRADIVWNLVNARTSATFVGLACGFRIALPLSSR